MLNAAGPTEATVSFSTRCRYRFDAILSKGIPGLLLLSLCGAALLMLLLTPILWGIGGIATGVWNFGDFISLYWSGFAGLFKAQTREGSWISQLGAFIFAIIALLFTGIVFGSTMRAITMKYMTLRDKGGQIIASDHTVLIGWSPLGERILTELAIANESRGKSLVAILISRPKRERPGGGVKVELEDKLAGLPMRTTRISVRSGNTLSKDDFDRVRLHAARNVIVLADWDSPAHDAQIITTLLAVARYRESYPEFKADVVTCVKDEQNTIPAEVAAKYPVTVFDARRLLARTMLQCSRQPGLIAVLSELLQFDGDEIYFVPAPRFAGQPFGDLAQWYPTSTPIGLVRNGIPMLHPPASTMLAAADEVIWITEDDDTALASDSAAVADTTALAPLQPWTPRHDGDNWLFTGWAQAIPDVLTNLNDYLQHATNSVTIIARPDDLPAAQQLTNSGLDQLDIKIMPWNDDVPIRSMLDDADILHRTYIGILGRPDVELSDSETLLILLHVRDITNKAGELDRGPIVVSELLNAKFRKICDVSDAKDIVVSSELVSLMLVQLAEAPRLLPIYEDIFDADGSEIYLKPAECYVKLGAEINFLTLVVAAADRGEIAIGYRLASESSNKKRNFGVHINPAKSDMVVLNASDALIVIAEDEVITVGQAPGDNSSAA